MIPAELKSLKGFNIEDGLNRMCGNAELYVELILEFTKEYADSADKYLQLIELEDKEPVRRLVHTIKGVAGNLGMTELHTISSELEHVIKEGEFEKTPPLFKSFQEEIFRTIRTIEDSKLALMDMDSIQSDEEIDPEYTASLLDAFADHARNRLAKPASETIKVLSTFNWSDELRSSIEEISQLARTYKLKEAADKADLLRKMIISGGF